MPTSARRLPLWLPILLLLGAAFLGWRNYRHFFIQQNAAQMDAARAAQVAQAAQAVQPARTAQHGQPPQAAARHHPLVDVLKDQRGLVHETDYCIAEMLAFAKRPASNPLFSEQPKSTAAHTYTLHVELEGESAVESDLVLKDFVWSPQDHAAWARALAAAWKLSAPKVPAGPSDLLRVLSEPTSEILQRESRRISVALTRTPLDPSLHEQAALVTAAFALREAAGDFTNGRRELCRIAAHLAVACALHPDSASPLRGFAEAALQTLAGREVGSLRILDAMSQVEGGAAWAHALRLRNTGDWRAAEKKMTLLEQLETFRARVRNVNTHFALAWIEKLQPPQRILDWQRLVLESDFGVEEGHRWALKSLSGEMLSLQADWESYHGRKLSKAEQIEALEEPLGRTVAVDAQGARGLQVLGWDFWSAQHQRHLCQSLRATNEFLRDKWGVPQYREFQSFAKETFRSLTLFPRLAGELTDPEQAVMARAMKQAQEASEAMSHPIPFGTLYGFRPRGPVMELPGGGQIDRFTPTFTMSWSGPGHPETAPVVDESSQWDRWLSLAPSNFEIRAAHLAKMHGNRPAAAMVEAEFGPLVGYNLRAMTKLAEASQGDSAKFRAVMERACVLEPGRYFALGYWLVEHRQPEAAAAAFQKGVDLAEDRVLAANECRWLVMYLEGHGQTAKALKIAQMAAEVYSCAGLGTMAALLERRGKLDDAEDYLQKMAERYPQAKGAELQQFYIRNRAAAGRFEKVAAEAEQAAFPSGRHTANLADFRVPPASGAVLLGANENTAKYQLKPGDVIVALDGYRVEDRAQYMFVRSMGANEALLKMIVWDGKSYRELKADVPYRSFGVELAALSRR